MQNHPRKKKQKKTRTSDTAHNPRLPATCAQPPARPCVRTCPRRGARVRNDPPACTPPEEPLRSAASARKPTRGIDLESSPPRLRSPSAEILSGGANFPRRRAPAARRTSLRGGTPAHWPGRARGRRGRTQSSGSRAGAAGELSRTVRASGVVPPRRQGHAGPPALTGRPAGAARPAATPRLLG